VTFAEKPSKPNIMAGVAARVPIGRAMLETDSPYLSPVPFRGKRNEPSRIPVIAQKLSELRSEPVAEIARRTTAAAQKLFRLPS
jgi:TatD DNase family protein